MANQNDVHTHTRETLVERRGSGATGVLAFIVGGLVVAVGVLGFVFWSGGAPQSVTAAQSAADSAESSAENPDNAAESAGTAEQSAADDATGEE